jgi:hypothetical protein
VLISNEFFVFDLYTHNEIRADGRGNPEVIAKVALGPDGLVRDNAVIGKVKFGQNHMSGNATCRDLAARSGKLV